jgi:hypothetical protein
MFTEKSWKPKGLPLLLLNNTGEVINFVGVLSTLLPKRSKIR